MSTSAELAPVEDLVIAQPEHALYCFDVLIHKLRPSASSDDALEPRFKNGSDVYPLFVTWNIASPGGGSSSRKADYTLRGCIGNFSGMPLTKGLQEYALISALNDHRFNPISFNEVPNLQCGVSLLTNFEDCDNAFDWTLGVHGIWIHFHPPGWSSTQSPNSRSNKHASKELSATFLPDVPGHAGWDQMETLKAAVRKAGYRGKVDQALLDCLRVRRYQSAKVSVTYEDWKLARGVP